MTTPPVRRASSAFSWLAGMKPVFLNSSAVGPTNSRSNPMKTYSAAPKDIKRGWYLIDADGLVLGRLAALVAVTEVDVGAAGHQRHAHRPPARIRPVAHRLAVPGSGIGKPAQA